MSLFDISQTLADINAIIPSLQQIPSQTREFASLLQSLNSASGVISNVQETLRGLENLPGNFTAILAQIQSILSELAEDLLEQISRIPAQVGETFEFLRQSVEDIANTLLDQVSALASRIESDVSGFITTVTEGITTLTGEATELIGDLQEVLALILPNIDTIRDFLRSLPLPTIGDIRNFFTTLPARIARAREIIRRIPIIVRTVASSLSRLIVIGIIAFIIGIILLILVYKFIVSVFLKIGFSMPAIYGIFIGILLLVFIILLLFARTSLLRIRNVFLF